MRVADLREQVVVKHLSQNLLVNTTPQGAMLCCSMLRSRAPPLRVLLFLPCSQRTGTISQNTVA
jgi:hypothetical protein